MDRQRREEKRERGGGGGREGGSEGRRRRESGEQTETNTERHRAAERDRDRETERERRKHSITLQLPHVSALHASSLSEHSATQATQTERHTARRSCLHDLILKFCRERLEKTACIRGNKSYHPQGKHPLHLHGTNGHATLLPRRRRPRRLPLSDPKIREYTHTHSRRAGTLLAYRPCRRL